MIQTTEEAEATSKMTNKIEERMINRLHNYTNNKNVLHRFEKDLNLFKQETIAEVEKLIESIDTQYPDDDGTPFEVLACNFKKELKQKIKEMK